MIWNDGNINAVREPLDNQILKAHLAGEFRVGSYLVDENGRTPYLVLDIDKRSRAIVKKIVRRLRKLEIVPYVERSKSKGFHIWVFFMERIRAKTARKLAHLILKDLDQEKIEVFPKQDVVPKGGLGNCIWLPYFPPDVDRDRTVFVNDDFQRVPKRWPFLRKIKQVSKKIVVKLAKNVTGTEPKRTHVKSHGTRIPALAACAQAILLRGVAKNHRNEALFTLAKHLRNAGLAKNHVLDMVISANEQCRPPLEEREVSNIAKSVFDKKYTSLGCENSFIASLCGDKCPVKKKGNPNASTSADEVIARAEEKPILHPAQAFQAGILWYGQKVGREYLWVNSERKALTLDQIREEFCTDGLRVFAVSASCRQP